VQFQVPLLVHSPQPRTVLVNEGVAVCAGAYCVFALPTLPAERVGLRGGAIAAAFTLLGFTFVVEEIQIEPSTQDDAPPDALLQAVPPLADACVQQTGSYMDGMHTALLDLSRR
jgi:hypothetical protein